jgi:hypothetical protein
LAHLELRLIIAKLVFNFNLSLPGGPDSGLKWEEQDTFVIWSKQPFHVALRPASSVVVLNHNPRSNGAFPQVPQGPLEMME